MTIWSNEVKEVGKLYRKNTDKIDKFSDRK